MDAHAKNPVQSIARERSDRAARAVLARALWHARSLLGIAWLTLGVGVILVAGGLWLLVTVFLDVAAADAGALSALGALSAAGLGVLLVAIGMGVGTAILPPARPVAGMPIDRTIAPGLFTEVDQLRNALGTGPLHELRLTPELDAGVVQQPRFGGLGPARNVLQVGLPVLLAQDRERARATLAQALAPLRRTPWRSGAGQRLSLHRHREHWRAVADAHRASVLPGRPLLARFYARNARRLERDTRDLARRQVLESDAAAASVTSVVALASSLVHAHAWTRHLEFEYWAPVYARRGTDASPPPRVWTNLAKFVREQSASRTRLLEYMQWALRDHADRTAPVPSLAERLGALQAPDVLPASARASAADAWLAPGLPLVLQRFDTRWWVAEEQRWQQSYDRARAQRSQRRWT